MRRVLALTTILFLIACGGEAPKAAAPGAATASNGLHELMPADADIVVHVASLERLADLAQRVAKAAQQPLPGDPVALLAMQMGVAPDQLDRDRPCAIAVSIPAGMPMPMPTFIVPVKDSKAVLAAYAGPGKAERGGYVALSQVPGYAPAKSALLADLPAGDVVVRLDLASIVAKNKEQITSGLALAAKVARGWDGRVQASMEQTIADTVASAERLDIVLSADDAEVAVDIAFLTKKNSPLAKRPATPSDLVALARALPADAAAVLLFEFDPKPYVDALVEMGEKAIAADGIDAGDDVKARLAKAREAFANVGRDWLVAANLTSEGISLLAAGRVKDEAGVLESWEESIAGLSESDVGAKVRVAERRKVAGIDVLRLALAVDPVAYGKRNGQTKEQVEKQMKALFGGTTVPVDLAVHEGRILCGIGHDMAAVLTSKGAPESLARALGGVAGELSFYLRLDLRALAEGAAAAGLPTSPTVARMMPERVEVFGARDGRVYHGGIRVRTGEPKVAAVR